MTKKDFKEKYNKVITSGFAFWGAILTCIVLLSVIISEHLKKNPPGSNWYIVELILIPAIGIAIYILFYKVLTNRLIKNSSDISELKNEYESKIDELNSLIVSEKVKHNTLTKNTIKEEFNNEFKKLQEIIDSADEHRNNLLHHFVITWEQSSKWELRANEICSITPNLLWTNVFKKEKIYDICKERNHKYKYIVRGNQAEADSSIHKINEKIHSIIANYIFEFPANFQITEAKYSKSKIQQVFEDVKSNFQIKKLSRIPEYKALCNIQLPLPGDLVLYKDIPFINEEKEIFLKTIALISLFAMEKFNPENEENEVDISQIEKKHKYDVQIENSVVYRDFETWFGRIWNKLSEIQDTNEVILDFNQLIEELKNKGVTNIA